MLNKLQLHALFWFGVFLWVLMLALSGESFDKALLKPAHHVLLILTLFLTILEKWLWKFWPFNWLVKRPNVSGVYEGELQSTWTDATGNPIPPIKAFLSIHQTLLSIQIRQYTGQSPSYSIAADFVHSGDGRIELVYTYLNDPPAVIRSESPIHYGTAKLVVERKSERLIGNYWTDRKTTGEMRFTRFSSGHCQSMDECKSLKSSLSGQKKRGFKIWAKALFSRKK